MSVERIKRDIVDNITNHTTMLDILNSEIPHTTHLDISTGYFDIHGYAMLKETLHKAVHHKDLQMRLLLGKQALIPDTTFEQKAQESDKEPISLESGLDDAPITSGTISDIASLISLLKTQNTQVRLGSSRFNHSKCYIMNDSVFIGSSNFTKCGLTGNYELNAGLYSPATIQIVRDWFKRMWGVSEDKKQYLITLLESSKFGIPAPPYDVYIKMIFEKYRDILTPGEDGKDSSYNIELTTFQKDAVHTALFIMSEFQGAIISDATGLGKTNMGMEILRQKTLKENRKVLLIAPAQVLHTMWNKKLEEAGLFVRKKVTMESLGSEDALEKWYEYSKIDFVLIDESQNFRSKNANRSKNLARIMATGKRKQALLLTATPINNSIMDLYYQISIITRMDDAYFWRSIGIPDLYKHMRDAANKEGGLAAGLDKIQRLLDAIMIRRTRSYIKEVYRDDMIDGHVIKFPEHEYQPIQYSLADLYGNLYERILHDIHDLTMAPYGLEQYNTQATDEERAKHRVLAHLQVILLLKRFESSIAAVRASLDNKIRLYHTMIRVVDGGRIVMVRDLNKLIAKANYIQNRTDTQGSSDDDFEMDEFLLQELDKLETEKIGTQYDIEQFQRDMKKDLKILQGLRADLDNVKVDKKLEAVRDAIIRDKALDTQSCKVIIFTEYTTTAKYLLGELRKAIPDKSIECITGSTKQDVRANYIERFSPKANIADDRRLEGKEIDLLVSTEVLAEGQNLQDCNYVINYDLPWNPMRIVQRIGRVDRLTSMYDVIRSRACYPDKELDGILKLMGKLLDKIQSVNKVIGLDAELLGETPTPHQYNGDLKDKLKILGGKGGQAASNIIVQQMERDADLMPPDTPLNEIARRAKQIGIDDLRSMPIGRRSGKAGDSKKVCILAYVRQKPERYVYFVVYDYEKDTAYVPDNEYDAINQARCMVDEPLYLPMDEDDTHTMSFDQLLHIDKKARDAIMCSDDVIKQYSRNANKTFEKTRKDVDRILNRVYKTGELDDDRLSHISNITSRTELKAWDVDLKQLIAAYNDGDNGGGGGGGGVDDNGMDTPTFLKKLEAIGEQMGMRQEIEVATSSEIDYEGMKLVGAMFVTPTTPSLKKQKGKLDAYAAS